MTNANAKNRKKEIIMDMIIKREFSVLFAIDPIHILVNWKNPNIISNITSPAQVPPSYFKSYPIYIYININLLPLYRYSNAMSIQYKYEYM